MVRIAKLALAISTLWLAQACCLPFAPERDEPPPPTPASSASPPLAPVAPLPVQPPPVPPPPPVSETELSARKAAEYSRECINSFSERASDSRRRYLSWVDAETGPTGRERHVYGVYTLGGRAQACRDAVTRAAAMPPSLPEVEQAAAAYASAIETLQPLLARADGYYERESWRDDGMAVGRELHPQLIAAFDAFQTADRDLRGHVERIQDAARAERIARFEHDPAQHTRFLVERVAARALEVLRMAETLELQNRRFVAADPQAFVTATQALQQEVDELARHRPAAPDRAPGGLSSFRSALEEYLQSALGTMRRVRDGEALDSSELSRLGTSAGWMTDGTPDEMVNRYNRMIDAYNRLDW